MHPDIPVAAQDDGTHEVETFLQETRIVLPGAQIFCGFLLTVPLQSRFDAVAPHERIVFVVTFLATLVSLVFLAAPAVYHRAAAPLREKRRFVWMGTRFVLVGTASLSLATALSGQLVISMVLGEGLASWLGACVLALIAALWWVFPRLRIHERLPEMR